MKLKYWIILALSAAFLMLALTNVGRLKVSEKTQNIVQSQVRPGKLSAAHAQLSGNCTSCHTASNGVDIAKCIDCHADNKALLERQPTAFHATIGRCATCHVEHQGLNANLRVMNHEVLARMGVHLIPGAKKLANERTHPQMPADHPLVSPLVAQLDCASCHSTKDKHKGLLGQNCASCHAITQWTIPAFQHPSVRSTDCAQCHQAPPSHYMMHFEMVDTKTAARDNSVGDGCCDGVVVNQCYKCHKTTSFNDIKGVGYYKHH